jgi:hypothetical protein
MTPVASTALAAESATKTQPFTTVAGIHLA